MQEIHGGLARGRCNLTGLPRTHCIRPEPGHKREPCFLAGGHAGLAESSGVLDRLVDQSALDGFLLDVLEQPRA